MGLISILLFLIGFLTYFSKHKYITLIVIAVLSTGYFRLVEPGFFIGPISLQHGDLALLLIFSIVPFRKKLNDKQLKGIKKALILFFIFLSISIFYDFFLRGTTPMQIFRTIRKTGYLAFFFLIYSFGRRDYEKFIRFIVTVTVIHTILYVSQYIFSYSLTGNFIINELGGARYGNYPTYIIPILVISLFTLSSSLVNKVLIVLLFIAILLAQSRGAIVSALSIFILYMFLKGKIKLHTLIIVSLLLFVGYNVTLNYFPIIEERFSHLFSGISIVGKMNYNNLQAFYQEGSFIFRWGVTYERFMYVIKEPVRIILGVGFVPDMDIISPIFVLGTHSPTLPTGFEQYNSVDILFPNIITRYGLVGSSIFLYFIYQLFKFSFNKKNLIWGKVLFTYLFSLLFISLINETFYNGQYFFFIFILIGIVCYSDKNAIPITNTIQNSQ